METELPEDSPGASRVLETFLRGMETPGPAIPRPGGWTLKPSLEGWKLISPAFWIVSPSLLETFLRGMETFQQ